MTTLRQKLEAQGALIDGLMFGCEQCRATLPPGALYVQADDSAICGHCLSDSDPVGPYSPPPVTWDDVRGKRTSLLSLCDWTQIGDQPDQVKQLWQPYRAALRNITSTFPSPDAVIWPPPPSV